MEIGKILRELCKWKEVNIITAEVCPDHVHMLVEIPPKVSISSFMGFLKGKSSVMIYQRYDINLCYGGIVKINVIMSFLVEDNELN